MCDINLNDPAQISKEITKILSQISRIGEQRNYDDEDDFEPLYKGSLIDNLTQNNPYVDDIRKNFQLKVEEYLIISKDFNFKTQLMRSLDINAENSYKIIIESINKINRSSYNGYLEHDMFKIMSKFEIREIYDYFDVSDHEEL